MQVSVGGPSDQAANYTQSASLSPSRDHQGWAEPRKSWCNIRTVGRDNGNLSCGENSPASASHPDLPIHHHHHRATRVGNISARSAPLSPYPPVKDIPHGG
jgi:hypothetical protein